MVHCGEGERFFVYTIRIRIQPANRFRFCATERGGRAGVSCRLFGRIGSFTNDQSILIVCSDIEPSYANSSHAQQTACYDF